jgi:histidine triad (HIT) family protein
MPRAYALYSKFEIDKILIWMKALSSWCIFKKNCYIALEQAVPASGGMSVIGLEVPHAHVHLIEWNGRNRFQNKVSLTEEEFKQLAQSIAIFIVFSIQ